MSDSIQKLAIQKLGNSKATIQEVAIRKVAIVGGVHGNEWTGIHVVKKFQQFPDLVQRPSLECVTLLANPGAFAVNRRYVDRDLNRCFSQKDLANPQLTSYEDQLAKAIAQQLIPPDAPPIDAILDLHSTTANMGLTILLASLHPLNLQLAAYLSAQFSEVRICAGLKYGEQSPVIRSLSPFGCTIEVGPIAQGLLDAAKFQQTEQVIHAVLDYLAALNQGQLPPVPREVLIYRVTASIDYPRDHRGDLQAMIHPQRQHQDYEPLKPGDPLFLTFTGETIPYQGEGIVFPVFINEAAYYEKGVAMHFTEKQRLNLAKPLLSHWPEEG